MNILQIIENKKNNLSLTEEEIKYFILNYSNNKIPDYQASALLMALFLNGIDDEELFYLTKYIILSGDQLNFNLKKDSVLVDKHSTGGIGDKVSLIISFILSSLNVSIAKISGRGLSFTGGTLDKLDSVGIKNNFSFNECEQNLNKHNMFIAAQDKKLVPADKKIYALRDATSTVNHVGLIASSILSKKFCINTQGVFIDIKVGDGAFCKNNEQADLLAKKMLMLANKFNRNIFIYLTDMSQPLGYNIGNKLEVLEAVEFLKDYKNSESQLQELIFEFCEDILIFSKVANDKLEAKNKIIEVLESQQAYKWFKDYAKDNGSNIDFDSIWFKPKYKVEIKAKQSGYLKILSNQELGLISLNLGAGRITKEQNIDFDAGIKLFHKNNSYVNKNETIAILYSSNKIEDKLVDKTIGVFQLNNDPSKNDKIILKKYF